jgi:small subunit ribosomal protein S7
MRKAKPKKRQVLPDPVYGDVKVSKFVNHLMYDGKKSISYRIFYDALEIVKTKMQRGEELPRDLEGGPSEGYSSGRGKEPSYRRCHFPGSY